MKRKMVYLMMSCLIALSLALLFCAPATSDTPATPATINSLDVATYGQLVLSTPAAPTPTSELISPRPTIYSTYTLKAPSIDGVLSSGEWQGNPLRRTLSYVSPDGAETHEMTAYFMNDDSYLYVAIMISNDDFESVAPVEPAGKDVMESMDVIELYFDNDNDGVIEQDEDYRHFWNLKYEDWHYEEHGIWGSNGWTTDQREDGAGAATHSNQQGIGDYVYEFKIPLDSGDPQDLSLTPGSTVGIKIIYNENHYDPATDTWVVDGRDGWPTKEGERVTIDLDRGYTLSFELPSEYQEFPADYHNVNVIITPGEGYVFSGIAVGPLIEETLTNIDGSSETSFYWSSSPFYDGFLFNAVCWPISDQRDLSVLIREIFTCPYEKGVRGWDWEDVYQEGAVNVPGDNGVTYPGYYAMLQTELDVPSPPSQLTDGFVIVSVEPDYVTSFAVLYSGPQDYTLEGWGTYTYTVGGQPWVAKHKADAAAMIASVKITGGPVPAPAETPAGKDTLTDSVPLLDQISTDPEVVGTNVGLAILTVLIFYLAATIFNGTIKENYEIIEGWLHRASKWLRFLSPFGSKGYKSGLRTYLEGALVVAICALIYWFLNPYFTNGLRGIALFVALFLGIAIATYGYEGTQVLVASRRFRAPAGIRIYPIAILIAAIFVALSNAIDFHPGLIYGFVGAYAALSISKRLDEKQQAVAILYGTLVILGISVGAFFLRELLYNLAWREGDFWRYLVEDILVAAIVIGLEGMTFSLAVPLSFLDGGKLRAWKFWVWLVVALAVAFVFYYIIINQDNKLVEAARSMKVITMGILMGLSLIMSVGTWLYFKLRHKPQSS